MKTRIFTREDLETLGLPDEPEEGTEIVSDRMVLHKRWSVKHEIIFRILGQPADRAWKAHYFVPATESQEQDPWDEAPSIVAVEVALVQRTIGVWEPVTE